jgi:molybdate transport system regulatory protein
MPKKTGTKVTIVPRFRIRVNEQIALGPGKADLLRHIAAEGSIQQAAKRMKMSYMRAWSLVKLMNASFREPLVIAVRGGRQRGGAALTSTGETVLALYTDLETTSLRVCHGTALQLTALLKA